MLVETTFHLIATSRMADVAVWTKQIGLIPSGCARRGERAGTAPSPDSWWALVLDKREVAGVEDPLRELLEQLLPFKREIAALALAESLEVTATSYIWEHDDSLVADLSATVIGNLHELGCSYSVVAYD